jgi:hypothetical protein
MNNDFALVLYRANGSLDVAFDDDGKLTTDFGDGDDRAEAVAWQTDGKILLAGSSFNGSDYDFALARYVTDILLTLPIDIKPGNHLNPISARNMGKIPVAISLSVGRASRTSTTMACRTCCVISKRALVACASEIHKPS